MDLGRVPQLPILSLFLPPYTFPEAALVLTVGRAEKKWQRIVKEEQPEVHCYRGDVFVLSTCIAAEKEAANLQLLLLHDPLLEPELKEESCRVGMGGKGEKRVGRVPLRAL